MAEPTLSPSWGQLTPEERKYILERMPGITTAGSDIERQQAMADRLRRGAEGDQPFQRMDWASQAARAIGGTYGGYRQAKIDEQRKTLSDDVRKFWGGFPDRTKPLGPVRDEDY